MSSPTSRKTGKGRMKNGHEKKKKNKIIVLPITQDEDKFMKLEEQLIPGIFNEITLDLITTKLPWRTVETLASVSRAWQQAFQDGLVYDARLRSSSAETLIVFSLTSKDFGIDSSPSNAINIYSLTDKAICRLPPIPRVDNGIPGGSQCVSVAGKIYILGGREHIANPQLGSQEVYMLDLAKQSQWVQCAPMRDGRQDFGCGVLKGKIYVLGGTSCNRTVHGAEVYDPSINAWSAINPGVSPREILRKNNVAVVGQELWMYGECHPVSLGFSYFTGLSAYDPVTDKWRVLSKYFPREKGLAGRPLKLYGGIHFVAQGKLHFMSEPKSTIYVYDVSSSSFTERQNCLFVTKQLQAWFFPKAVLEMDNELLAIGYSDYFSAGLCLVQSVGFGSEDTEIVFKQVPCRLSFEAWRVDPFMRLLKL